MYVQVNGESTYVYTGAKAPVEGQPNVVFIHGAGLNHTVWTMQARYFAYHGCNAFVPDPPVSGWLGREPSAGTSLEAQPDTSLQAFVDIRK